MYACYYTHSSDKEEVWRNWATSLASHSFYSTEQGFHSSLQTPHTALTIISATPTRDANKHYQGGSELLLRETPLTGM